MLLRSHVEDVGYVLRRRALWTARLWSPQPRLASHQLPRQTHRHSIHDLVTDSSCVLSARFISLAYINSPEGVSAPTLLGGLSKLT
ncbi:unnamed protein product [Protopolystoma xenopodis]|uniref:Uncharacterized protein n=1 Tax=Protopolystoma xenopodis TaxID=117903 RepID=A0A3S5AA07_9PLAT|nr:unnamed protein product [Protopolystoma xenopodis]